MQAFVIGWWIGTNRWCLLSSPEETCVKLERIETKMDMPIRIWIFLLFVSCIEGQSYHRNNYETHFRDPELGKERLKNLARILQRVKNSSEFHPLKFSVSSLTTGYEIADSITKYLARQNLTAYQVDIDSLSVTTSIRKYFGVTWIIVVDNLHILYPYIHLEKDLWKPISKFIIVFVGQDTRNYSRLIFQFLWRRYNVCKVLITFVHENFRCLYKYSPFKLYREEYGTVEKVYLDGSELSEESLEGFQDDRMKDIRKYSKILRPRNLQNKLTDDALVNLKLAFADRDQYSYIVGNGTEHFDNQLQRWSSPGENEKFIWNDTSTIFENFSDFNNYTLNVVVFNSLMMEVSMENSSEPTFSGIDGEALMTLKKYMNSHFRIKVINRKSLQSDPFFEALHKVRKGKADIVITGYFMKFYEEVNYHEFTVAVYEDKLCLLAPSSGPIPKYVMPFIPFSRSLWCLILFYNVLVAILWQLMKYYNGEVSRENQRETLRRRGHRQIPKISRRNIILSKLYKVCRREHTQKSDEVMRTSTFREDNPGRQVWKRHPLHDTQTGSHVFPQIEDDELDRVAGNYQFSKQPVTASSPVSFRSHVTAKKYLDKLYQTGPPEMHPCLKIFVEIYINVVSPFKNSKSPMHRLFLCNILMLSIVIVGLYQSCLVSTFSKPIMKQELHTLADVAETNLDIVTKYYNLMTSTFTEDTPVSNKLRKRMKTVHSKEHTKDVIAFKKNAIALARFSSLELEDFTTYYDEEGNKLLHVVEECPSTYMIAYVVKFFSPYLEKINALLLKMSEAGLFREWYENMIYPIKINESRVRVKRSIRDIKLTFSHYSLTFLVLLIGLFGCTLVFLTELYVARNWKRRSVMIVRGRNSVLTKISSSSFGLE